MDMQAILCQSIVMAIVLIRLPLATQKYWKGEDLKPLHGRNLEV
jgi:hypothetical protein